VLIVDGASVQKMFPSDAIVPSQLDESL